MTYKLRLVEFSDTLTAKNKNIYMSPAENLFAVSRISHIPVACFEMWVELLSRECNNRVVPQLTSRETGGPRGKTLNLPRHSSSDMGMENKPNRMVDPLPNDSMFRILKIVLP